MTNKMKPHQIYNKLKDKYDELTRPSGLQQIYDKQKNDKARDKQTNGHSTNVADQIKRLENMVSEGHGYVRSIIRNSGKPPCLILYNDEQITDIRNLCCTGQTVLGIDKTFMLCKMHVTVTCYKQMTVKRQRTDEPPLFIGPLFIHDNSDFATYSHFFHHLKLTLIDTDLTKLVIGTDDEQALVKAIMTVMPEVTHVLCTRHLKENTRHHLVDDAVTAEDRDILLNKIYGKDGLVDAEDSVCFDAKCTEIEADCISDNFKAYFDKRLKGRILDKVNRPFREGKIGRQWTNNNCESINHVLKQTVDWKTKGLTEFVQFAQQLTDGQFKDLRASLVNTGEFRLADSHGHYRTTKTDWITMTENQRTNLYRRYRQHVLRPHRIVVSTDGQSTVVEPRTNGRKPGQRKRPRNERTLTLKRTKHDGIQKTTD